MRSSWGQVVSCTAQVIVIKTFIIQWFTLYISLHVPSPHPFYNIQLRQKCGGPIPFQIDQLKTTATFSMI